MKNKNQQLLELSKKILVNLAIICKLRIQLFIMKGTFSLNSN